jgi:hypothetical protein
MHLDQFVELVTIHPRGGIKALLEIAGYQEVEWLEFKAAACDSNDPRTDQSRDLQWRIARAVIGMVNSRGGCVAIGIADDGTPVPIAHSDPDDSIGKFGSEYFLRKSILERILQPEKGWKAKQGQMILDRKLPAFCFEVRLVDYASERVVLILVHPLPIGGELLRVVNKDLDREFVPIRQPGHVGLVRELSKHDEIRDHTNQRRLDSPEIIAAWNSFIESHAQPGANLESEVATYISTVKNNLARLKLQFTELDGDQREDLQTDSDLLIPEVDEIIRWIDPDSAWSDQKEITEERRFTFESSKGNSSVQQRKKTVLELLRQVTRAVLIGHPGSGKTTCLQRLALQSAENYCSGEQVALFVPFAIYRAGGIFALLRRVSNISLENLNNLAQSRRLLLLLDGLNECPTNLLNSCTSELKSLLQRFPDLSIVISCRTGPYSSALGLPTFEVLPLSEHQQFQFLEQRTGSTDRAAEILRQLRQSPASMASNPLLLTVAAEVARMDSNVPSGLGSLYMAYIDKWFEREKQKAVRAQEPLPWTLDQVISAFSAVAYQMRIAGKIVCDPEFAVEAAAAVVTDPEQLFERLAQGLLFVLNSSQGSFGFEHETLQELLCALQMLGRPESLIEALEKGQNRDRWRMPIAFLFEIGSPGPDAVKTIWSREPLIVAMARSVTNQSWFEWVLQSLTTLGNVGLFEPCEVSLFRRLKTFGSNFFHCQRTTSERRLGVMPFGTLL